MSVIIQTIALLLILILILFISICSFMSLLIIKTIEENLNNYIFKLKSENNKNE